MTTRLYRRCSESDIPQGVRFDTPLRCQGQAIEVSYGSFGRAEADVGDPFKRVIDHSVGPGCVTYFKLDEPC